MTKFELHDLPEVAHESWEPSFELRWLHSQLAVRLQQKWLGRAFDQYGREVGGGYEWRDVPFEEER